MTEVDVDMRDTRDSAFSWDETVQDRPSRAPRTRNANECLQDEGNARRRDMCMKRRQSVLCVGTTLARDFASRSRLAATVDRDCREF